MHWVILAGRRKGQIEPIAAAAREPYKALVKVAGVPMLERVLKSLLASGDAAKITIIMQEPAVFNDRPEWQWLLADERIVLRRGEGSISENLLSLIAEDPQGCWPLAVTTADNVLLTPEIIRQFHHAVEQADSDLAVAFVSRDQVSAAYPDVKKTYWQFSDSHYAGCNLYLFRNLTAVKAISFWRQVEQDRKKIWRVVVRFGVLSLLLYKLGFLTLASAFRRASRALGAKAQAVVISIPEACIDIDKAADLVLTERILLARGSA